jgi:putative peptidoglycan lipid II flippase
VGLWRRRRERQQGSDVTAMTVQQRQGLLRTTVLVAGITSVGTLLGFVRDLIIARYFGASGETDAFLVAWTIPETAVPLVMEGSMLLLLMPLFARELEEKGSLREFVGRSLVLITTILLLCTVTIVLTAPWLVEALAPGLAMPELATRSVRTTALTVVFLGLCGYMMAALRARHVFGITATVYTAYNIGIISAVVCLQGRLGVYSAALGVAVGSALMLLIQLPSYLRHIGPPALRLRPDRALLASLVAFVPLSLYALGRQAQVYIERFLGSSLDPGAISHLNYASKVGQVPMLLASMVAVVAFPSVARTAVAGRLEDLQLMIHRYARVIAVLILPAMAFLIVSASELVGVLFERGAFSPADTAATASILRIYALGLLGQTLVNIAVLPLFSIRHLRPTAWYPARAALVGLIVAAVVSLAALPFLGVQGLAAGNAAGISVLALLLLRGIDRYVGLLDVRAMTALVLRTLVAAGAAAACCFALIQFLAARTGALLALCLGALVMGVLYLAAGRLLRIGEIEELTGAARARWRRDRGGAVHPPPPVLMYHSIARMDRDLNRVCVSPERFEQQLDWLHRNGLRGVSMRELCQAREHGAASGLVGLTFDDGYRDFLTSALPTLERYGFTATLFIVAGLLGGENEWDDGPRLPLLAKDELREIRACGIEIGSHGLSHVRLAGLDHATLRREVQNSRELLSSLLGEPVDGFCYPYGSLDGPAVRAVQEAGYAYGCGVKVPPAAVSRFSLPRTHVGERDGFLRLTVKRHLYRPYAQTVGRHR